MKESEPQRLSWLNPISAMDEDNAFGQKLSETVNYPDFSKTFSYTYDSSGLKCSFTMPDGSTVSYTYNDNNGLEDIRIPGVGNISYPSYTMGRPDSMSSPGDTHSYAYDALARLEDLDSSTLDYSYTYDDVGNILTKQTEHGNYVYDYDDVYRLTSVDNPIQDDEAYTYDGVGNRETASGVSGSITHNANNELTVYGDISYDYDANGNMIRKSIGTAAVNYIYDVANRLIRVEDDVTQAVIAEYDYDPFGRRLWKVVQSVRTYFLYADEGLVAEYDENGNEIRSYGYQPDSTWTTDPLWLKEGGSYYWYQNDHLGTPQKLIAGDGTVVWSAQYNAFGEADVQVETVTNNLRFPGQYEDAETGLSYNYHRYYDPKIGRYLRIDPVGFLEGDINLYVYVTGNPVNAIDVEGLYKRRILSDEDIKALKKFLEKHYAEAQRAGGHFGIDAVHILTLSAHESDMGRSACAKDARKNFFAMVYKGRLITMNGFEDGAQRFVKKWKERLTKNHTKPLLTIQEFVDRLTDTLPMYNAAGRVNPKTNVAEGDPDWKRKIIDLYDDVLAQIGKCAVCQ